MTKAAAPAKRSPPIAAKPAKTQSTTAKPAPRKASKTAAPVSKPALPVSKPALPAPRPAAAASKPYLRFYHSVALRKRTIDLLDVIEGAADPTVHREALADLVIELTDSGMDYCFVQPLKLAKPGFVTEQSAKIGLVGVQQVIGSVSRRIIGRMGGPQLVSVCGSIRQFML